MALIIEDGSIVTGANSFTTDAELVQYAADRSFTLPATEAERDALQILAMDYIFSVEDEMQGLRVSELQELPYPRNNVCLNCFLVAGDSIPETLKKAQMELAVQANTSELLINKSTQNVAKQKLGDLEVEYFSGGSWSTVRTDRADTYLKPLLRKNGGNLMMRSY